MLIQAAASAASLPRAAAVIVAAGRGERFGAPDKVFLPLAGRPMLSYVLDTCQRTRSIAEIILVVGLHTHARADHLINTGPWDKVRAIVSGGERRQDSVAAGVRATPAAADLILIHDGARPLVSSDLFERCLASAAANGAALAAVPVTDTLKRVVGDRIVETTPRENLWAAQTPQAFRRELLVTALADPRAQREQFTDEAGLLEALGMPVAIVAGDPANIKITHPTDLTIAEALLSHRGGVLSSEVMR